jgi:hypothetical protein
VEHKTRRSWQKNPKQKTSILCFVIFVFFLKKIRDKKVGIITFFWLSRPVEFGLGLFFASSGFSP